MLKQVIGDFIRVLGDRSQELPSEVGLFDPAVYRSSGGPVLLFTDLRSVRSFLKINTGRAVGP